MTPLDEDNSQEKSQERQATLLSIVLPVFNEVAILQELTDSLRANLRSSSRNENADRGHGDWEIIFVNDGSSDGSDSLLDELAAKDQRIRVVHFSRNFGHQPAVHAGLAHARGDVVLLMDSDMQDDPQAIHKMMAQWQQGYDVVYAVRTKRKESLVKRTLFHSFYRLMNRVGEIDVPMDAGNFGLLDRAVVKNILAVGDHERYLPGIRSWVGFRQTGVKVERLARHDDTPRVSVWQLFRLAKTAIFGFSNAPLAAFSWCAGIMAVTFAVLLVTMMACSLFQVAAPRWMATFTVASFFGALNAVGIAIVGEYVARIHDQVRNRPKYIVARTTNSDVVDDAVRSGQHDHSTDELELFDQVNEISRDLQQNSIDRTLTIPTFDLPASGEFSGQL